MTVVQTGPRCDIKIADLAPIPLGSLVLIASHYRDWRDAALVRAAANGSGTGGILYLALSEHPGVALDRWQNELARRIESLARQAADKEHGEHEPSYDDASKIHLDASWRTARAATIDREQQQLWRLVEAIDISIESVARPTVQAISRTITPIAGSTRMLVVDDMASMRRSNGTSGSPRMAGEHARALKDLAVELNILVLAGLSAPQVFEKNRKEQVERFVSPSDFASLGQPDAAADAVITAVEGYHGYEESIVTARYGSVRRR
ncbi:hypothetical protein RKE25_22875 (plasmid) [Dyella sp. BiH032]|uniref:hypothetical protein n=1 Tax=Dyella sp. BiH032 TaxID=3075430 RepID=UPI0028936685|nr:hypothetical protein [Dyella sp. BiH032]WNL48380.1 hypothetical protein RKE25_22875 [Dyella sp. BiH032]